MSISVLISPKNILWFRIGPVSIELVSLIYGLKPIVVIKEAKGEVIYRSQP